MDNRIMNIEIPAYMNYWGKADSATNRWHPLVYHMLDVAAVARKTISSNIVFCRNWSDQLDLKHEELLDIIAWIAAIHDLGKFASDFQCKIPELSEKLIGIRKTNRIGESHPASAWLLWNRIIRKAMIQNHGIKEKLTSYILSEYFNSIEPLLTASFGHHGAPSKEPQDHSPLILEALYPKNTSSSALELIKLFLGVFPGAKKIFEDPEAVCKKQDVFRAFSFPLSGLIITADWTASDPNNFFFEYDMGDLQIENKLNTDGILRYYKKSLKQAEQVIERQGIKSSKPATLGDPWRVLFDDLQKYKPSPLQQTVLDHNFSNDPSLFIIEDIAGAGKTEAALILISRLMQGGMADGFYFGLPTMATSNGMYPRIAKLYEKLFDEKEKPSLILAHGASALHEDFQKSILPEHVNENIDLEHNEKNKSDNQLTSSAACRQWLADRSKKVFLAQVGVGSIDQAMLAVIYSRHFSLRMYGLGSRILIIDEVHAYDVYMQKIIQNLLQFQASQGKSVILLSATLPAYLKHNLSQSYLSGLQNENNSNKCSIIENSEIVDKKESDVPYPLMTVIQKDRIDPIPVQARSDNCRTVSLNFIGIEDEVYTFIENASNSGKCIVWIRNTVGDVQNAYASLAQRISSDKLLMFHSRFAMRHRQDIEDKVLSIFGSDSNEKQRKGQVLIASQVVEQSLDLDFDEMIIDLCPIDLVIQRVGRLRRHNRDATGNKINSSDQRGQAILNIFGPDPDRVDDKNWYKDHFPGASYVYDNPGILWRTASILKESGEIRIPDKLRFLVEMVYGKEAQKIPELLVEQVNKSTSKDSRNRGVAQLNQINLDEGYIRNEDLKPWPDDSAPTRLSEDTEVFRLCTLEGDSLRPLIKSEKHAWAMSEVKFRPLAVEYNKHDQVLIEKCNAQLFDQGRGGKLMILSLRDANTDESEMFQCKGVLSNGKTLLYDKWSGLRYE